MAREMKDSEIPWIGKIPKDWSVRPIKSSFLVVSGATPKSNNPEYWDGDVVWVTPADYKFEDKYVSSGKRNLTQAGYDSCGTTLVPAGSIIFSKRAPIGTVAISNCTLCTNQGCLSCVPKPGTSTRFFYYTMAAFPEQFNLYGAGTTFKEISSTSFSNFKLPLPPYSEQEHIADFLDAKCALIDDITEKTRASVEEYKKLKQSMITEAVTKGIRPGRPMKESGIPWIGKVPEDWEVFRIANLYEERNERGSEELPILSVSINTGISDHEIPDDEMSRIFVRSADRTLYKRVYPGDLAYNMMRAWQGAFGAVRVEGMVSPAYIVAKPKNAGKMDSRYVEALLRTPSAVEEMHRYSRGITDFRLRLYWPEFKNIRICVPPIQEQKEIADYLDEKSAAIDALIDQKTRLITELGAYKKSLIYEYVTGKKEVA